MSPSHHRLYHSVSGHAPLAWSIASGFPKLTVHYALMQRILLEPVAAALPGE